MCDCGHGRLQHDRYGCTDYNKDGTKCQCRQTYMDMSGKRDKR